MALLLSQLVLSHDDPPPSLRSSSSKMKQIRRRSFSLVCGITASLTSAIRERPAASHHKTSTHDAWQGFRTGS
jgi:hypothetical protein